MELLELAAQAYTETGRADKALLSHQQIIQLYPFPNISSAEEQARWNQTSVIAVNAVRQLVSDYRATNQIEAGILYLQFLQRKYANSPLAQAARTAEQKLKS